MKPRKKRGKTAVICSLGTHRYMFLSGFSLITGDPPVCFLFIQQIGLVANCSGSLLFSLETMLSQQRRHQVFSFNVASQASTCEQNSSKLHSRSKLASCPQYLSTFGLHMACRGCHLLDMLISRVPGNPSQFEIFGCFYRL